MTSQIFFYIVAGLVLAFILYRHFKTRSVPRLTPSQAEEKVRSGEAIFLDVRTDGEWGTDHIKGSIHIPLRSLRGRGDELKKFGRKEVICYCRTGNQSVGAAARLRTKGINASSLEGGIGEWNFQHRARR